MRQRPKKHRTQGEAVVLFVVGDHTFAIAASAVSEIQGLQDLKAIVAPSKFGKVHHTVVRDGRRYWVVDANLHFQMLPTQSTRVLLLTESPVAVKVDAIVRMTEIGKLHPLPNAFQGEEKNWYLGLTVIDKSVVPLVNPAAFISHYALSELEASSDCGPKIEVAGAMA
jgi:chemotaxis signal transduction protein